MFAACVMIYVILAWLFGSYLQPFAVMLAMPIGALGALLGALAIKGSAWADISKGRT